METIKFELVNGKTVYFTPTSDTTCEKYVKEDYIFKTGLHVTDDSKKYFNTQHVVLIEIEKRK